jgi:predicted Zn-dependent protease
VDRIALLKEVLAENPTDALARYGLALEHVKAGDIETALAEFATLRQHHPEYVPAYQMAAQALMKASRYDEARAMLNQGIACATRNGNRHAEAEMQGMLDEIS